MSDSDSEMIDEYLIRKCRMELKPSHWITIPGLPLYRLSRYGQVVSYDTDITIEDIPCGFELNEKGQTSINIIHDNQTKVIHILDLVNEHFPGYYEEAEVDIYNDRQLYETTRGMFIDYKMTLPKDYIKIRNGAFQLYQATQRMQTAKILTPKNPTMEPPRIYIALPKLFVNKRYEILS